MKLIVFKGFASIAFSGDWGALVLEGSGVINRVDEAIWNAVYKSRYKDSIDSFIKDGIIEISNSKDADKKIDEAVKQDTFQALEEKQEADRQEALAEVQEVKDEAVKQDKRKKKPKNEA